MSKKSRSKLGDVYSIPLPTGKYAFCRLFEESVVAVFDHISDNMFETPSNHSYLFFVGVYKYVLTKTDWTKVGNVPFLNEEDKWPPPFSVYDIISRNYYLYHKGEMKLASEKECKGLEPAAVWDDKQIVDRIMEKSIWKRD